MPAWLGWYAHLFLKFQNEPSDTQGSFDPSACLSLTLLLAERHRRYSPFRCLCVERLKLLGHLDVLLHLLLIPTYVPPSFCIGSHHGVVFDQVDRRFWILFLDAIDQGCESLGDLVWRSDGGVFKVLLLSFDKTKYDNNLPHHVFLNVRPNMLPM